MFQLSPLLKRRCKVQVFVHTAENLDFFSIHFFSSNSRDFHFTVEAEFSVEFGTVCQEHDKYFL